MVITLSQKDTIRKLLDGDISHAEGMGTVASGSYSHAEGAGAEASGNASHAEGTGTLAEGYASHAEGYSTKASGEGSHAEGYLTTAFSTYQHVQGRCNIEDANNTYAHIVGNGERGDSRSNAHTLDWEGNAWFAGSVVTGGDKGVQLIYDEEEDALRFIFLSSTSTPDEEPTE